MTANEPTAREGKGDTEYRTEYNRRPFADGSLPVIQVPVPVHVPEEIEEMARDRWESRRERDDDVPGGLTLNDYLLDQIQVDPQFLTRDVVQEEYGEPLSRALYTCVTEEQYRRVVDAVDESDAIDTTQAWVRDAIEKALSDGSTPGRPPES